MGLRVQRFLPTTPKTIALSLALAAIVAVSVFVLGVRLRSWHQRHEQFIHPQRMVMVRMFMDTPAGQTFYLISPDAYICKLPSDEWTQAQVGKPFGCDWLPMPDERPMP